MTEPRRWRLQAATSHLLLSEHPHGLVVDGWGPDALGDGTPYADRPVTTMPEADEVPLLFPVHGFRHLRGADLEVRLDEELGVDFHLGEVEADARSLRAVLVESHGLATVELQVRASDQHDVFTLQATVRNTSDAPIKLAQAYSGSWYVPSTGHVEIEHLSGQWGHEFTQSKASITNAGTFTIGSLAGITGHEYTPWLQVRSAECTHSVALAWCGSWQMGVEQGFASPHTRVFGGVPDTITLAPGEEFVAPASYGLATTGDSSQAWRDFTQSLGRGTDPEHHPVVYNSWYATTFDVNVEHQKALADQAAALGIEVFVVDDGWFTGRNDDHAALGDWTPDPVKFPDGLTPLIDHVKGLGMGFGLWVEPEAVNPNSELFRAHPDWIHALPGREPMQRRNQYMLDFGRPEVVEWAKGWLRELLGNNDIGFLKWDMNRPLTDRLGGTDWAHRHAAGYLEVMRMLREEFPQVTVEACAGGGGRIDTSVLPWCDVVWVSDEVGPRDRLAIQHGFFDVYPPSIASSWVSHLPDHRDALPTSLEFRCLVAMCGVMGIGVDLTKQSPEALATMGRLVERYKQVRPVVHTGRLVRHGLPSDDAYAVEFIGEDRTVVMAFRRGDANLVLDTAKVGTVAVAWQLADDCDLLEISHG